LINAQRSVSWLSYRLANLTAGALMAVANGLAGCSQATDDDSATMTGPLWVVGSPTLFGIDVSKWQGNIDQAKVKGAGVKYVFIRVSHGITNSRVPRKPQLVTHGTERLGPDGLSPTFHGDEMA